jgi:hypothetical protein
VYQIVGDISLPNAPGGTTPSVSITLAVELAWLQLEPVSCSHRFQRWKATLAPARLEEPHTILESVTTAVQKTEIFGEC